MTKLNQSGSHYESFRGINATIMGLGTFGGGIAAARYLADQGAVVSITDLQNEKQLTESLAQLDDISIQNLWLGAHPDEALENCDLLIVNPAVPPDNTFVRLARERGIGVTSEIELFLAQNKAPVIAVTGSNGKSTTAALIRHMAENGCRFDQQTVWLGGNIGNSLLGVVDEISDEDVVVLELSSFQLHQLGRLGFAPRIAVVTNFSANHLDWHGSEVAYRQAKSVILKSQSKNDVAILPGNLIGETDWPVRGQTLTFGVQDYGEEGVFAEDDFLIFRKNDQEDAIRFRQPPQLPGKHNLENITAAACAVWQFGLDPNELLQDLSAFESLPHRLQTVAHGKGIRFVNDSISTTPESSIAALDVYNSRCVILAGGYDKGMDLSELAAQIAKHTSAAILMGQTADLLKDKVDRQSVSANSPITRIAQDFGEAFSQAVEVASPGDIVLLSPGCASYGWFRDFRDRGDQFTQLAQQWINDA